MLVSAASGAVGSVVGQLAKMAGCRAVGIAGGPEKCAYVRDELGFDACIDHREHKDVRSMSVALKEAAPNGIDGLFENVGGVGLDAALARMNAFGRIAVCGLIAGYEGGDIAIHNTRALLVNRLSLRGFIVSEHLEFWPQALGELGQGRGDRQDQVSRVDRGRPGRRAGSVHRHAARQELRQAAGQARPESPAVTAIDPLAMPRRSCCCGKTAPALQVLLTKRAAGLSFMGGLWVFPGGRMEASDLAPELAARADQAAIADTGSRMLGADAGDGHSIDLDTARGLLMAACRETFEESGVLLARHARRRRRLGR